MLLTPLHIGVWFTAVPMECPLDDGDGPHYSQVKPCTLEFYRTHAHLVSKLESGLIISFAVFHKYVWSFFFAGKQLNKWAMWKT